MADGHGSVVLIDAEGGSPPNIVGTGGLTNPGFSVALTDGVSTVAFGPYVMFIVGGFTWDLGFLTIDYQLTVPGGASAVIELWKNGVFAALVASLGPGVHTNFAWAAIQTLPFTVVDGDSIDIVFRPTGFSATLFRQTAIFTAAGWTA